VRAFVGERARALKLDLDHNTAGPGAPAGAPPAH
jgi:hypothetical protein